MCWLVDWTTGDVVSGRCRLTVFHMCAFGAIIVIMCVCVNVWTSVQRMSQGRSFIAELVNTLELPGRAVLSFLYFILLVKLTA